MGIKERIREIIDNDCGGSNIVFANRTGIVPSTIQKWDDEHLPNGDTLQHIHEKFSVNINYLLTGIGELYINKDRKEMPFPGIIAESVVEYEVGTPGLRQAMDMLATVLESKNQIFIRALMSDLVAFSEAVKAANEQNQRISDLKSDLDAVHNRLSILEQKSHKHTEVDKTENFKKKAM